jgi:hypothetical protein
LVSSLGILHIMWYGELVFPSILFGVQNASCIWMSVSFPRSRNFSAIISSNIFPMNLIWISAHAAPWIFRFDLMIIIESLEVVIMLILFLHLWVLEYFLDLLFNPWYSLFCLFKFIGDVFYPVLYIVFNFQHFLLFF